MEHPALVLNYLLHRVPAEKVCASGSIRRSSPPGFVGALWPYQGGILRGTRLREPRLLHPLPAERASSDAASPATWFPASFM